MLEMQNVETYLLLYRLYFVSSINKIILLRLSFILIIKFQSISKVNKFFQDFIIDITFCCSNKN
jgi:hypothetical protein